MEQAEGESSPSQGAASLAADRSPACASPALVLRDKAVTARPLPPRRDQSGGGGGALRSEVVRLNVGGVVYVTTEATLRSRGENFFTGLLDRSREWTTGDDGDGALFVDRNGLHFGPILDFMRTGRLVVPPGMDRSAVEEECNFYLIDLPEDARPQHQEKWDTCLLQWRVRSERSLSLSLSL
jgi:hypothetical protein